MIKANKVSYTINNTQLLKPIDLSIKPGCFTAIIGANGAGKTTLLNLLCREKKATSGTIYLDNQDLSKYDDTLLAQKRAVLPQVGTIPFSVSVFDIVSLGRLPYRYIMSAKQNKEMTNQAIQLMGINALSSCDYRNLSGGEKHRVQIARVLAQIGTDNHRDFKGKLLFLDEPTNHLDIRYQFFLLNTLKSWVDKGLTVVTVMHDLSLALRFSDDIILLHDAEKKIHITANKLVDYVDLLSACYQIDFHLVWHNESNSYLVIPKSPKSSS